MEEIVKNRINFKLHTSARFCFFIGFYIYMIYGIHPSDEGNISISCTWENGKLTTERTTIIQGERVVSSGEVDDCVH